MSPAAALYYDTRTDHEDLNARPAKKLKIEKSQSLPGRLEVEAETTIIPPHPLGIKPSGNAYTAPSNLRYASGLFARLPDNLLIELLEFLDKSALLSLGSTCKALYAFASFEELWKTLFINSPPPTFSWRGTWRKTLLSLPSSYHPKISCQHLYSDALYRPFQCAHTPLRPYITDIPPRNAIPRLPNISSEEFSAAWTDEPFILTEPVREWPAYKDWSSEALLDRYRHVSFRAEAVDWPLETYTSYMRNCADEESPLYLFDRSFAEKMGIKIGKDGAYWPPECLGEDLFEVLGEQRPDSRWLIVGPARSGSTFHKDPNATSAWNAVIRGSKYWLLFPPSNTPPPGVFLSPDSSEITSPLSIAEYLLSFHAIARNTPNCYEGICNEGEILHVPSGWFHLVLNLEESVALTQNFVPRKKAADVLEFLRDKKDQVSGFREDVENPYGLFVERLRERYPEALEEGLRELERREGRKRRKWEELVKMDGKEYGQNSGFSFGFGGGEDDEEVKIP